MIEFKVAQHLSKGHNVVEIRIDGMLHAVIYPLEEKQGFKVIAVSIDQVVQVSPIEWHFEVAE